LTTLGITNDLYGAFPTGTTYELVSLKSSGNLFVNSLYNGSTNTQLLNNTSKLNGKTKDSIDVVFKVNPNGYIGNIQLLATQTSKSTYGIFQSNSYDPTKTANPSVDGYPTTLYIPKIDIIIPSGFSPNGDGMNDNFVIIKPSNVLIQFQVYDRTGAMVYQNLDYKNDWNGISTQHMTVFGKDLPNGTYFYIATSIDRLTGKSKKFHGYLTMRR